MGGRSVYFSFTASDAQRKTVSTDTRCFANGRDGNACLSACWSRRGVSGGEVLYICLQEDAYQYTGAAIGATWKNVGLLS